MSKILDGKSKQAVCFTAERQCASPLKRAEHRGYNAVLIQIEYVSTQKPLRGSVLHR